MHRKELLRDVKRIVVKIGTSILTEDGVLSSKRISMLVRDIVALIRKGYQVAIVTSGAISAGAALLKKKRELLSIPEKQAMAAVGQIALMNEWRKYFIKNGYEVGQILLTEDDVRNRKRYLNARHTFNTLLAMGVIPVINENDSVVITEIRFGDNDTLSAYVSNIIEADLLILLSDVDGLYINPDAAPADEICEITDDIVTCAGGAGSIHGSGGMTTKIKAADIIIRSGEKMIIGNGRKKGILQKIMSGVNEGTLFIGKDRSLSSRKRWIAFNMETKGKVIIDAGAVKAICGGMKSLLATGITNVSGDFEMGDAVEICDNEATPIAKGIVNYSIKEIQSIKGKKTFEIKQIIGENYFEEVIHRDNMILY